MFKKNRRLLTGALCGMLAAMLIVPAAAHGGRWGRGHHGAAQQSVQTAVTACSVEGCTLAGYHTHDGVTYCGHNHGAGVCDNSCRALCTYEDCDLTGYHTHDGVGYCGYNHAAGYCDGVHQTAGHHGHGHCHG